MRSSMWSFAVPPEVIERIMAADNLLVLRDVADEYLRAIGFRSATYHLVSKAGYGDSLPSFVTSYPDEWIKRYEHRGYLRIDPVMLRARKSVVPFAWSETIRHGLSTAQIKLLGEATVFGLSDGITVPIHFPGGFAIFTACADGNRAEREKIVSLALSAVTLLALHVHSRAERLLEQRLLSERGIDRQLTRRELECVRWLASGKSVQDIGDILGLTRPTVTAYLRRAAEKLQALNRVHLCVKAISLGLIDVS